MTSGARVRSKAETLLLFHHIYSPSKRTSMRRWALGLGPSRGQAQAPVRVAIKIGRPGRLFVSGSPDAVHDFVARVKQLRWQSCRVESSALRAGAEDEVARRSFDEVESNTEFLAMIEAIRSRSPKQ